MYEPRCNAGNCSVSFRVCRISTQTHEGRLQTKGKLFYWADAEDKKTNELSETQVHKENTIDTVKRLRTRQDYSYTVG